MDFREWLKRDRGQSKRELAIEKDGVDPKTGLTNRSLTLTEKKRMRGGKNSRRRTAQTWEAR